MTKAVNENMFDPALAMARQSLYRFTALSLLDPKAGAWSQLDALRDESLVFEAAGLLRDLPEAVPEELAPGEHPLTELDPSAVLMRLPLTQNEFNVHYEATFGLLVSNPCPPYEVEYIDGKYAFQRSNDLADISGFYRAFGVTPSRQHPERPDHIVQELEFMAVLIGLARQAADVEPGLRAQRLRACHAAQERFLREHLSWWVPAFAKLLIREDRGGFYEAAAILLSAFLTCERSLFRLPATTRPPEPSELEKPEACEGCLLP